MPARSGTLVTVADPPLEASDGITSRQFDGGCGALVNYITSAASLDLSGTAADDLILVDPNRRIQLVSAVVLYPEATSSDTGITLSLGIVGDDDEFGTVTSDVSQSAGTAVDESTGLLANDTYLEAGEVLKFRSAGSKTGTGTARVCIGYTIEDE